MAWTELHQSAAWHRKTVDLGKKLGVRRPEALGLICTLWLWALEHAQDGQLGHLTEKEVSAAAGWHKTAKPFVLAIHDAGFLDDGGYLHDWHDYAGRLIEQRQADIDQKRTDREQRRVEREAAEVRRKNGGRSSGDRRKKSG